MTQQTYILNHLQNLMPYPFEQRNTLFVTSPAGAETSRLTFHFSCSNTRLILPVPTPTPFLHKKNTHRCKLLWL